jgi:hypothetical protein
MCVIVKSMSIKRGTSKRSGRISITCADSNVSPRKYARKTIDASDNLGKQVSDIGKALFDGRMRFLPSCSCMAHEAYYLACNYVHATPQEARDRYADDADALSGLRNDWVAWFSSQVLNGTHDASRYVLMKDVRPMCVKFVTDDEANVTDVRLADGKPSILSREQVMIVQWACPDDAFASRPIS